MTVRASPSGPPVTPASTTSTLINDSAVEGVTASDALDTLASEISLLESGYFFDQFQGGVAANSGASDVGRFGDRRWSYFSTSANVVTLRPATGSYIGAYALVTDTALATNLTAMVLSSSAVLTVGTAYRVAQFNEIELLGAPDTAGVGASAGAYRYGLGSDPVAARFGSDGLYFEVDKAVSNNWRVVSRVGGVNVATIASTIPFTAGVNSRLRMEKSATVWSFYVDDVLIGTIPIASITTALVTIGLQVSGAAASSEAGAIDEVSFFYTRTIA